MDQILTFNIPHRNWRVVDYCFWSLTPNRGLIDSAIVEALDVRFERLTVSLEKQYSLYRLSAILNESWTQGPMPYTLSQFPTFVSELLYPVLVFYWQARIFHVSC